MIKLYLLLFFVGISSPITTLTPFFTVINKQLSSKLVYEGYVLYERVAQNKTLLLLLYPLFFLLLFLLFFNISVENRSSSLLLQKSELRYGDDCWPATSNTSAYTESRKRTKVPDTAPPETVVTFRLLFYGRYIVQTCQ